VGCCLPFARTRGDTMITSDIRPRFQICGGSNRRPFASGINRIRMLAVQGSASNARGSHEYDLVVRIENESSINE
jgi:hypothetical protein